MRTIDKLKTGNATFTLSGKGRSWSFRLERVSDNRGEITFARVLINGTWCYLGVYDSEHQYIRLTSASRFDAKSVVYRALSWYLGRVWAQDEAAVASEGFSVEWVGEAPVQSQPAPVDAAQPVAKPTLLPEQIDAFYRAINRRASAVLQKRRHRHSNEFAAGNAFTGTVSLDGVADGRRKRQLKAGLAGSAVIGGRQRLGRRAVVK